MHEFFSKYNIDEDIIAVGVSGGADSLALVFQMYECGKKVVALTVDHGLRAESSHEAEYVAAIMKRAGIEHYILSWQGDKPQTGIEEAARQARYKLMFDFCRRKNIKILATGHHRRDQAETFLLRLQRGSGVFGLSCILPISQRGDITIIRPQLNKSPENLRAYLKAKGIEWIEDPMNQQDDFARVKMRKFLPELAQVGIDEKRLADTAAVLANTRMFLQNLADKFIVDNVRNWSDVAVCLSWHKLKNLHKEISLVVLGQLIKKIGGGDYLPEASEIKRVLEVSDNFKGCTLGNCELFMAAKRLWIVPQDKSNLLMTKQEWSQFIEKYSQYRHAGLPYKVRRAVRNRLGN